MNVKKRTWIESFFSVRHSVIGILWWTKGVIMLLRNMANVNTALLACCLSNQGEMRFEIDFWILLPVWQAAHFLGRFFTLFCDSLFHEIQILNALITKFFRGVDQYLTTHYFLKILGWATFSAYFLTSFLMLANFGNFQINSKKKMHIFCFIYK